MTRKERAVALLDILEANPATVTVFSNEVDGPDIASQLTELLRPDGTWFGFKTLTTDNGLRFISPSAAGTSTSPYANVSVHLS